MTSIIVPVYNVENYLTACIESILGQTESDLQVILVDDGSTDGSLAIAQAFAAKDTRIEIYTQSHAGQSKARNNGLTHAKGDYIAFVDADDALERDWVEQHLAAIDGVDYVQSGYKRITVDGKRLKDKGLPVHPYQFTSPCMRLYRHESIQGKLFEEGVIYEDVRWSIDLWLRGTTCKQIPYTGYLYTLNPKGTTSRSHPEEQYQLFQWLRSKNRTADCKGKMIIRYTMLRLKLHYWKQ